mmetsp:Transcript_17168/g.55448  ORF Transcript_17168/g.55448 Transcript_17168/m.55448 type:complete len:110 (-) Transcript_17168:17-346(-)
MYVVLRKDLDWPVGAQVNQACHACAAVAWEARDDPVAAAFFSEAEGQMTQHTLGASDLGQFTKLSDKLCAAGVRFRVWVEQPESVPSSLATWPRRRSEIKRLFNGVNRF